MVRYNNPSEPSGQWLAPWEEAVSRWFIRMLGGAVGLATLVVGGLLVWIVADGLTDDRSPADVIVVLGNQILPSGEPHPRLEARLAAALDCYAAGCAPVILVSGGTGVEGFDESVVMKGWLEAEGVPADAVIADPYGLSTRHTARNAAELMAARGWSRAIVATQFFHITRCKLAFRQAGVSDLGERTCPLCGATRRVRHGSRAGWRGGVHRRLAHLANHSFTTHSSRFVLHACGLKFCANAALFRVGIGLIQRLGGQRAKHDYS